MSRAFVREDADNENVLVPQRAPLPDGTPNLVTPRGLAALQRELMALRAEIGDLRSAPSDEAGSSSAKDLGRSVGRAAGDARALASALEQLAALEDRIGCAQLVEETADAPDQVSFGTTVTVRNLAGRFAGEESRFTLVGVDEADPLEGLVAFTAPVASALIGHRVGDVIRVDTRGNTQRLEVLAIDRPPPA